MGVQVRNTEAFEAFGELGVQLALGREELGFLRLGDPVLKDRLIPICPQPVDRGANVWRLGHSAILYPPVYVPRSLKLDSSSGWSVRSESPPLTHN